MLGAIKGQQINDIEMGNGWNNAEHSPGKKMSIISGIVDNYRIIYTVYGQILILKSYQQDIKKKNIQK